MIGFGATGFSPYSQWWGNNTMGQGVQTNPVADNTAEVNQLRSLGQQQQIQNAQQNAQRNKLVEAMLRSGMFRNSPLTSMAMHYLNNGGQGLGLGSKIMSGIKGLFGG